MSNSFKDLYDYDLVKKCSKREIVSLKSNFHENKTKNERLKANCVFCRKKMLFRKSRLKSKQSKFI